jgi:hypothetical protein
LDQIRATQQSATRRNEIRAAFLGGVRYPISNDRRILELSTRAADCVFEGAARAKEELHTAEGFIGPPVQVLALGIEVGTSRDETVGVIQ